MSFVRPTFRKCASFVLACVIIAAVVVPAASANLVLLTDEEFIDRPSVLDYVTWQKTRGLDVNLVSLAQIRKSSTGRDDPEKIRNFLKSKLTSWNIQYLLILGTTQEIPTRYCHVFGPEAIRETPNQFIVPTDLYYGDMTGDWDSDGDGLFGEFKDDSADFTPEIFVGRIPEATPSWIDSILAKIEAYPAEYDAWKELLFQVGGVHYYPHENGCPVLPGLDGAVLQEKLWNNSLEGLDLRLSRYRFYEKAGLAPSLVPNDEPWTASNLEQEWETQTPGFVFIAAHGSQNSLWRKVWDSDNENDIPESSPSSNVFYDEMQWPSGFRASGSGAGANTRNLDDAYPAFVVATGSSTAWVDGYNLGKGLLRRGGIGFVGASRPVANLPTWDSPTDMGFYSLCYDYCQILFEEKRTFGQTLSRAIVKYSRDRESFSVADYTNVLSIQLVGDPSIRYADIWSEANYYDLSLSSTEKDSQRFPAQLSSEVIPGAEDAIASKPSEQAVAAKKARRIEQVDSTIVINPHIGLHNDEAQMHFEDFSRFDPITVFWDGSFWVNTYSADASGKADLDWPIPEKQISGLHLVEGSSLIGASYWDSAAFIIRSGHVHPSLDVVQDEAQPGEWVTIKVRGFVPGDYLHIYIDGEYHATTDEPLSVTGALTLSVQVPLDAPIGEDITVTAVEGSADVEGLHWARDTVEVHSFVSPALRIEHLPLKTGQAFMLEGAGFPPNAPVSLWLDSASIASVTSDSFGALLDSVTVPLTSGPGEYIFEASSGGQSATRTVQVTTDLIVPPGTDVPVSVILENLGFQSVDTKVVFELTDSNGSRQTSSFPLKARPQRPNEVIAEFDFVNYENYLLNVTASGSKDRYLDDNVLTLSVSAAPGWDTNADGLSEPEELFLLGLGWSEDYSPEDLLDLMRRWQD